MKDDNVNLELSREDAERLEDLLDGLFFFTSYPFKTSECLVATGRIIVLKSKFDSVEFINMWCRRLNTKLTIARIKAIADRTDPMLP